LVEKYLRNSDEVQIIEVTKSNRDDLVQQVCHILRRMLYDTEVCAAIEKKHNLSQRYALELEDRLTVEEKSSAWTFQGNHGSYHIRKKLHQGDDVLVCDCPFYSLRHTCSHTIVLTLVDIRSRSASSEGKRV